MSGSPCSRTSSPMVRPQSIESKSCFCRVDRQIDVGVAVGLVDQYRRAAARRALLDANRVGPVSAGRLLQTRF
jgi:hypothetical protein